MKKLLLILCITPFFSHAQIEVDQQYYEQLLKDGQHKKLFLECNELLKKAYGKTSPLVFYYIGRSLCAGGYTVQGGEWYKYVRNKFPIEGNFGNELKKAETTCSPNQSFTPTVVTIIKVNTSYVPSMPSGVRGKSGFSINCESGNEDYTQLSRNDSLHKRLFDHDQKAMAIQYLRKILPTSYGIDSAGRFIVVSLANSNYQQEQVQAVAKRLEFAYQFFKKRYSLKESSKLFTVYLLPDKNSLQQAARKTHDIYISNNNIGYSSLKDQSLLGLAKPNSVGTLFHELFHLMIRSDVGDISPWLDEGMACLYSVYTIKNNEILGEYDTWRVAHFKYLMGFKSTHDANVPSLRQLLSLSWNEFDKSGYGQCSGPVNYALSNFFVLYLQYKGLLTNVVDKFNHRHELGTDSLLPGPSDIELVEMAFRDSIGGIEAGYYQWLNSTYNIDMKKLVKQRGSFYGRDFEPAIQVLYDSINALINTIDKDNLVKKSVLKDLQNERAALYAMATAQKKSSQDQRSGILRQIANQDMDAQFTVIKPDAGAGQADPVREKMEVFLEKLRGMVKP